MTPVLALGEVVADAHIAARGCVVSTADGVQAAPAPRFSASAIPLATGTAGGQAVELAALRAEWHAT